MRAGTRFNTRGVDDNGSVANFVETEVLVYVRGTVLSSVQIRGSVPLFWEQQGLQVMAHKIQIARGAAATQPAVDRHFAELIARYQQVHILNLLSQKEGSGELTLSDAYKAHVMQVEPELRDRVDMTTFDFHAACKGGNFENLVILLKELEDAIYMYGVSVMDTSTNAIVLRQRGIFRTNCLDCLDRTNVVQSLVSRKIVENYLSNLSHRWLVEFADVFIALSTLYADNGDALSKMYAGTGALKSGITRTGKMTLAGFFDDATKSATRFYLNNFADKAKQETIDTLLGKLVTQKRIVIHDPVHEAMTVELRRRSDEYHSKRKVFAVVGTYNVNGKLPTGEPLHPWLEAETVPDFYVLGFQEIVELSPQQIMSTDPSKRVVWEDEVSKLINGGGGSRYVLLRSGQVVGAAIMVFVKEEHVAGIRNVECVIKKTGLRGISGNKGAIAVRFDFHDTSVCFVTAHLAAGTTNYDERNKDYHTITSGLTFAKGRTLLDHENVIWLGDFNYRIDMPIEDVKACIDKKQYEVLARYDQLNVQRLRANAVFKGFTELELKFDPTYKYDNGTSIYDTSEKMRVPAWTDRVLFRGPAIRQLTYQRAELYLSDHRPVKGLFELDILVVDKEAKEQLQREIYRAKKEELGLAARVAHVKVDTLIDFGVTSDLEAPSTTAQPEVADLRFAPSQGVKTAAQPPRHLPSASAAEGKYWWDSNDAIHESFLSAPPQAVAQNGGQIQNPFDVEAAQPVVQNRNQNIKLSETPATAPSSKMSASYIVQRQREQMERLNDPESSTWQPLRPVKASSSASLVCPTTLHTASAPTAASTKAEWAENSNGQFVPRIPPPLPPKSAAAAVASDSLRKCRPAVETALLGNNGLPEAAAWLDTGGPVQAPQPSVTGPGGNPFTSAADGHGDEGRRVSTVFNDGGAALGLRSAGMNRPVNAAGTGARRASSFSVKPGINQSPWDG